MNNSFSQLCLSTKDRHDLLPQATDGHHHRLVWWPTLAHLAHRAGLPPLTYSSNPLHFDEEIGVEEALDDDQRTGG